MVMLYAGKTSSVLVAFIFLPLFSRLLGPELFGIVAVILSVQALLTMMDLGMSTLVGREVAVSHSVGAPLLRLIRTAELSLSGFYIALLGLALIISLLGWFTILSWVALSGVVLLLWVLVMQNLYYCVLVAQRDYTLASLIQIIGVTIRAGATAYILAYISATLEAFIYTQLFFGVGHWWVSRLFCFRKLRVDNCISAESKWPRIIDAVKLTRSGGALIVFSAAGAAVMQLDKPLITAFISAASVTPYYLAGLLCMTPISMLAGPVSQYFQPIVMREASQRNGDSVLKLVRKFTLMVFTVTALPTFVLWWFRVPIIELWVGQGEQVVLISKYVGILLPGLAVGALGFVPYSLLVYAKDFSFQAILSACMSMVTLLLAALAASKGNVEAVCIIYSAYHATSTVSSWIRAMRLPSVREYAWCSSKVALMLLSVFFLMFYIIDVGFR